MASSKSERPTIVTFADHEIITPPNKLAEAVTRDGAPDDDPVARAEQALANLSSEFSAWMHEECERLDVARRNVNIFGFSKQNLDELFHAAHDLKGDAATFGYPAAAPVAESLCRLIEYTPDADRIPLSLVDQHVDAIRAIVRECARPDAEDVAAALTKKLRQVSDEFLAEQNKYRPDYLAAILSPPTTPSEFF